MSTLTTKIGSATLWVATHPADAVEFTLTKTQKGISDSCEWVKERLDELHKNISSRLLQSSAPRSALIKYACLGAYLFEGTCVYTLHFGISCVNLSNRVVLGTINTLSSPILQLTESLIGRTYNKTLRPLAQHTICKLLPVKQLPRYRNDLFFRRSFWKHPVDHTQALLRPLQNEKEIFKELQFIFELCQRHPKGDKAPIMELLCATLRTSPQLLARLETPQLLALLEAFPKDTPQINQYLQIIQTILARKTTSEQEQSDARWAFVNLLYSVNYDSLRACKETFASLFNLLKGAVSSAPAIPDYPIFLETAATMINGLCQCHPKGCKLPITTFLCKTLQTHPTLLAHLATPQLFALLEAFPKNIPQLNQYLQIIQTILARKTTSEQAKSDARWAFLNLLRFVTPEELIARKGAFEKILNRLQGANQEPQAVIDYTFFCDTAAALIDERLEIGLAKKPADWSALTEALLILHRTLQLTDSTLPKGHPLVTQQKVLTGNWEAFLPAFDGIGAQFTTSSALLTQLLENVYCKEKDIPSGNDSLCDQIITAIQKFSYLFPRGYKVPNACKSSIRKAKEMIAKFEEGAAQAQRNAAFWQNASTASRAVSSLL